MKFGFVTCVQLGLSCMEAVYDVGGKLDLVISLKDSQSINKSGRIFVDKFCEKNNISVHKSSHINNADCIAAIKAKNLDWLFIIGWSQIANSEILSAPRKGVLGIHPTLLPEGRGRASIPWAIIKGLDKTGVTLFKLDEGVDTGGILDQLVIPLSEQTTATELYELVDKAHIDLMRGIYPQLKENKVLITKQDDTAATEWPGRDPSDGKIDLDGSVFDAERLVRAVTSPYPGAFTKIDGIEYIIWESKILDSNSSDSDKTLTFKDGILSLTEYQLKN